MKKFAAAAAAFSVFLMSGCMMSGTEEAAANPTSGILMYVVVMLVFFGAMYFIAIRPQRKQEKEQREMLATMQVGDTVLTTSGFYGVVIDITEDTVIVEFGSNKNCRIPMQKSAVVQLEHPSTPAASEPPKVSAKDEGDQKK